MQVGIVRMLVPERLVPVQVGMWLGHLSLMDMIVMGVMHMKMIMLKFLVDMLVLVAFGKMKPEADGHQHTGDHQLRRHRFPQQQDGKKRANEWCQ